LLVGGIGFRDVFRPERDDGRRHVAGLRDLNDLGW
jgi:hypothetical protein